MKQLQPLFFGPKCVGWARACLCKSVDTGHLELRTIHSLWTGSILEDGPSATWDIAMQDRVPDPLIRSQRTRRPPKPLFHAGPELVCFAPPWGTSCPVMCLSTLDGRHLAGTQGDSTTDQGGRGSGHRVEWSRGGHTTCLQKWQHAFQTLEYARTLHWAL